jgi:hypothetical protein
MPTRVGALGGLRDAVTVQWTGLLQGDDGAWVELQDHADRALHVRGTFGGATVTFQGSNEPTAPAGAGVVLTSAPTGASISLTAAGARQIVEAMRWVRPVLSGGDGTTSLTVDVIARR